MIPKNPLQSKTLWYTLLSVSGVVMTMLLTDDNFKELLGSYVIVLYVLDKLIQAYLRVITVSPIELGKPKLNPVEKALKDEEEEWFY